MSDGGPFGDHIAPERGNSVEVSLESIRGMLKVATGSQGHVVFSDEPPDFHGGTNLGPRPLDYFTMGLGFCHLTQIERYAEALKIDIANARMHVKMQIARSGSVLGQTMKAECLGFDVRVEVESTASPEQIASCLRNAEGGCYAVQAIANPVIINETLIVNGEEFDLAEFPPPAPPSTR
jgi:uncharacterized OsmC-like protein